MVQVTPQEVPKQWRPLADLFEIGFLYVLLPLVVSTMDRPPLYLGGKILLWMVAWFFLRRLSDIPGGKDWASKNALSALLAVAGAGLLVAGFVWSGILGSGQVAPALLGMVLLVLPACALVFLYLPARLSASEWITPGWRPFLPAFAFAGLHLSSGLWLAPIFAFLGGYLVARLKLPLWLAALGQWTVALLGARWLW